MNIEDITIHINDKENITINLKDNLFSIFRKVKQLRKTKIKEKTFFNLSDFLIYEAYPIDYIGIKRCKVLGSDTYIHINLGTTILKFYKEHMSIDFFIKNFSQIDKRSTIMIDGTKRNLYDTLIEFCMLMNQPEECIELSNAFFFDRLRYTNTLEIDLKMEGLF